jgi:hypothetical protein
MIRVSTFFGFELPDSGKSNEQMGETRQQGGTGSSIALTDGHYRFHPFDR